MLYKTVTRMYNFYINYNEIDFNIICVLRLHIKKSCVFLNKCFRTLYTTLISMKFEQVKQNEIKRTDTRVFIVEKWADQRLLFVHRDRNCKISNHTKHES